MNRLQQTGKFVVPTLLVALLLAGCHGLKARKVAGAPPPTAATNAPAARAAQTAWAEVAYVNKAQGYVVLRAKVLQSAAGEATVWRGTNEVARLKVAGPARPPWLTADILSGNPQIRDRVEMKRLVEPIRVEKKI
jgi:hypothetical protein